MEKKLLSVLFLFSLFFLNTFNGFGQGCATKPTATISGTTTICTGGSATITFTASPNSIVTYKINSGADLTVNVPSSGSATVAASNLTSTTTYSIVSVKFSDNTCSTNITDSATVTVNPEVIVDAGTPQTVCAGETITLAGKISGGATTGTWSAPSGSFSNNGSLTSTYTPSIASGTVTLTLTSADPSGPCPSATHSVDITVNPATVVDAGTPQTVCAGGTITLAGSVSGGATSGTWSAPSGTFSNAGSLTSTYTPSIDSGTVTLTLTSADSDGAGPCSTVEDTVEITVNPETVVDAGTPQTVCAGGTITLAGSVSGGATSGTWSAPSGTFSNNGSLTSTYTPSIESGTVILTLTSADSDGAGPCSTVEDTVEITVNPETVVDAGEVQTVCAGGTITLAGSVSGGATSGTWSAPSGIFSNNGSLTSTYTPSIESGTVILTLTSADSDGAGPCSTVEDTLVITVNPETVVDAGEVQTVCAGGTITLAGSISGGATTGTWSAPSGTFSNNGSLTSTYTPSIDSGTVTLTLTSADSDGAGPCSTVEDIVEITVNPETVVDAGEVQTVCAGGTINLAGSVSGGATTGTWSAPSGIFSSAGSLTSTYTPSIDSGTVILTLTSADSDGTGPCTTVEDTVVITVNPETVVDAGEAQTVCAGGTITLAGSVSGGATSGTWSAPSGTFSSAGSLTSTYTPSIDSGTVTLTLTSADSDGSGPCTTVEDTVEITVIEEIQIVSQPVKEDVCSANRAEFAVEATGANLSYQWYKTSDAALEGSAISGATSNTFFITSTVAGDAGFYYVLVSGASVCNAVKSEVVSLDVDNNVVIQDQPTSQDLCIGDNLVLTISATADGGDPLYKWRKDGVELENNSRISGVSSATLTISDLTDSDAGKYDVIIDGNDGFSCDLGYSEAAIVTVFDPPTANAGTDFSVCSTSSEIAVGTDAEAGNFSTLEWTIISGSGTLQNNEALTATYIPAANETGDITLQLQANGNGSCTAATDEVIITIIPLPVIDSFTYQENLCASIEEAQSPTVTGQNEFSGGTYSYVFNGEGNGTLNLDTITGEITPFGSTVGSYTITYTVPADGSCDPVTKTADISISPLPIAEFSYENTPYCHDSTNPTPTLGPNGTAGIFSSSEGLVFVSNTTGEIDIANSTPGSYTITNTVDLSGDDEDGCSAVTENFDIIISAKPIPDFTYSASEFCSDPDVEENIVPIMGDGAVTGIFSYTATPEGAILALDTTSGEVDIKASEAGEFVITNTVDVESDGCGAVENSFTISINKKSNPDFEYTNAAYCISSQNAAVAEGYETGGTFSSPTLGSYIDANTGAITWSGTDAITGTHQITYTIEGKGACEDVSSTLEIKIDPLPVGGKLAFADIVTAENNGRIFMICEGATSGYLPITLTGNTGDIIAWKYSVNGAPWITIPGEDGNFTGSILSASQIQALNLPETTVFRVEIGSGACTPNVFSQTAILSVIPTDIEPTPVTVSDDVVCFGDEVTLSSETGYSGGTPIIDGGAFDNAGLKNHGWRFLFNGNDANFETNANNTNPDFWSRATPRNFPTASLTSPYNTSEQLWDPAVEDGNKGFAIVSGQHIATMETPVFSIGSMDQAILTFDQAYNLTPGATISVEISTNGGASYETVLFSVSGPVASGNSGSFGTGTPETRPKNKMVIDLGNYLGQNNLRIRFNYVGARTGDIWAVDAIKVPEGPRGVTIEWNDYTNAESPIFIGNTNSVQYIPTKIGLNIFEVKTKLVFDTAGNTCEVADNAENIEVFVFDTYSTTATATGGSCGNNSYQLGATVTSGTAGLMEEFQTPGYTTEDGYQGQWEVVGPSGYIFSASHFTPAVNDPNATFNPGVQGEFTLTWKLTPTIKNSENELLENSDCPPVANTITLLVADCTQLDFDGEDDYVDLGEGYNGNYSIEAWIRPFGRTKADGTNTDASKGTIISTPNREINMEDLPSGVVPNDRWFHIAVDSDGTLYVDGIVSGTISKTGSNRAFIGGRWNAPNTENHFSGWIEEVRIWNGKISQENIRFTMNQRLKATGNIGVEIDMAHPDAPDYTKLAGYYQLIATNILNGGYTPDLALNAVDGKLRNMETLQENTAPLPYTSAANGIWSDRATWTQPVLWDFPNSTGVNGDAIEWNIVRTAHNIESEAKDIMVLGLISEINELTIAKPGTQNEYNPGQFLRVTHYLKLDGVIDLIGESQLLQDVGSIVDAASTGYLERDQQGTANSYNYNYWSSPVSPGTGNADYTIAGVMRDGSNTANPVALVFGEPYAFADGGFSTPRKVSSYWLHKFRGKVNEYSEWQHIGSTGALNVGEGYTMKGTSGAAAITDPQNYVFVGIPNNGNIALAVGTEQNYLLGNPYPSAISVEEFLKDNLKDLPSNTGRNTKNVFNGALYFWDHFAGKSHILKQYIGGYATRNLLAGVPAISSDERINANDSKGVKEPGPYIPVGQGFFINTTLDPVVTGGITVSGGDVVFENNQRAFVPDTNGPKGDAVFHRPEEHSKQTAKKDTREKIRLVFKSPMGFNRQILVGIDPNTTNGFDLGYDAPLNDYNAEDMYWIQDNNYLVIQGVPNFGKDQVLPLGIKIEKDKNFSIEIDTIENPSENLKVYIRDILNDTVQDLRKNSFVSTSVAGYIHDRFEIIFYYEDELPVDPGGEGEEVFDLTVRHSNRGRELQILNPQQVNISNLYLFDLNGNQLENFEGISNEKEVRIPLIRNYSSGVYIIKLYSEGRTINKKIILNN